ncbi:hypothetical protein LINPERPRIM_LOCUS23154 [Linum perenne]
MTSTYSWG